MSNVIMERNKSEVKLTPFIGVPVAFELRFSLINIYPVKMAENCYPASI